MYIVGNLQTGIEVRNLKNGDLVQSWKMGAAHLMTSGEATFFTTNETMIWRLAVKSVDEQVGFV